MSNYITFVLDETGSMSAVKDEAISGFNKYLETLKKEMKGRTYFSLLTFDSEHKTWRVKHESLKKVEDLNEDTYRPGAMTPLWDAVGHAIKKMEKKVKGKKDPVVIITILTDGFENASREFTDKDVKKMIKKHKDWAFNFVGAGIDAWEAASGMGIAKGATVTLDKQNIRQATHHIALASGAFAAVPMGLRGSAAMSFYNGATTLEDYENESSEEEG